MFANLDTGLISSLSFTPDGRRLVFCCGMDAAVAIWDLVTGSGACQVHVNGAEAGSLTVLPNGKAIVVQTYDPDDSPTTTVFDLRGNLIRKLPGYISAGAGDTALALDSTGRYLIASGYRQPETEYDTDTSHPETVVWNTQTWQPVDKLTRSIDLDLGQGAVNRISHDMLTLSPSGRIVRYTPPPAVSPLAIQGGYPASDWWKQVRASRFPDRYTIRVGRLFVRVSGDHASQGQVDVWDLAARKRVWSVTLKDISPLTATVSPDGHELAIAGIGNYVHFFDLATGRPRSATWCITDLARCLAYSPNGRVIAAGEGGNEASYNGVALLDARTHRLLAMLKLGFDDEYFGGPKKMHFPWSVALPDRSFLASESALKSISPPGPHADAAFIRRFNRPARVRAALRACYAR